MLKKIMLMLTLAPLMSCMWVDHFDVSDRLNDEELEFIKTKKTLVSQYDYLLENNLFTEKDFYSPAFFRLKAEKRIEIYLKMFPNMNEDDKKLITNKYIYNGVEKLWVLAILGPPISKSESAGGFDTWYYAKDRHIQFHQGLMVSDQGS